MVGFGEFVHEAFAQAGGLLVVVVEGVLPPRVGDLERGVEGVAEADHPLPARLDGVGGASGAVARGVADGDAGQDLFAFGHGAQLRRHGLDHVATR
jgi:hypothetical protein